MTGEVPNVPSRGRAAAAKLRRNVHDRYEVELHPPELFGLMEAEQAGLVQKLLVFPEELPGILGLLGALPEDGHDLPRPPHRFAITHTGEITAPGQRLRGNGARSIDQAGHHDLPWRAP
jgi:hypothetical protein